MANQSDRREGRVMSGQIAGDIETKKGQDAFVELHNVKRAAEAQRKEEEEAAQKKKEEAEEAKKAKDEEAKAAAEQRANGYRKEGEQRTPGA